MTDLQEAAVKCRLKKVFSNCGRWKDGLSPDCDLANVMRIQLPHKPGLLSVCSWSLASNSRINDPVKISPQPTESRVETQQTHR